MKYILLFLISLLVFSCSESKMLLKSLNNYQVPIDYLHDSKIVKCDKSSSISFAGFENLAFDTATSVTKINGKLLPLIIYNYQETNLAVDLGQSSITQNYEDFFKESFAQESQRTGCFTLVKKNTDSDYTLEIKYNTCQTKSKYQRNSTVLFFLFAYSMSFQEIGFPSETDLALNVKLKQSDKIILDKNYSVSRTQPFINAQTRNVNNLRSDFMTNMVESLSLGSKECIEQIIGDINDAIK